jgi:hypothetical protein
MNNKNMAAHAAKEINEMKGFIWFIVGFLVALIFDAWYENLHPDN